MRMVRCVLVPVLMFSLSAYSVYAEETALLRKAVFRAEPFPLSDVKLLTSPFTENRDRTIAYLKFLDPDRMLHNFRTAAGLPSEAESIGGWEEPSCKLRGHSTGHYILALAQAWAETGDPELYRKLNYMVEELDKCRAGLEKNGNPGGFLSAYDTAQFNRLEELTPYPEIWAPYYTLHKIMAGLIGAYRLAGIKKALALAEGIGVWVYRQLREVPEDRLQRMWDLYIAGEFGGINESLADLYGITGKKEYLEAAEKFVKKDLLDFTRRNRDFLAGLHANQHIPQMTGYLKIYEMTGNTDYYTSVRNFWNMAAGRHAYINGGVSEAEMFHAPDRFASFLTEKTCETCCAYNMLKLTRELFFHDPSGTGMDYYERALFNQILASQDPEAPHTSVTYFMPLNPGGAKNYSSDYGDFTCCHGTGMENHTKYQDSIYFCSPDNRTLYVNLYIPSILDWKERGLKILQETEFPDSGESRLTVKGSGEFEIRLRIPGWAKREVKISVNGKALSGEPVPGQYLSISRKWKNNDTVFVSMPFPLRIERLPDLPFIGGIMNGPILLVAKNGSKEFIRLQVDEKSLEEKMRPGKTRGTFMLGDLEFVPMYRAHHFPYHAYFLMDPAPGK